MAQWDSINKKRTVTKPREMNAEWKALCKAAWCSEDVGLHLEWVSTRRMVLRDQEQKRYGFRGQQLKNVGPTWEMWHSLACFLSSSSSRKMCGECSNQKAHRSHLQFLSHLAIFFFVVVETGIFRIREKKMKRHLYSGHAVMSPTRTWGILLTQHILKWFL